MEAVAGQLRRSMRKVHHWRSRWLVLFSQMELSRKSRRQRLRNNSARVRSYIRISIRLGSRSCRRQRRFIRSVKRRWRNWASVLKRGLLGYTHPRRCLIWSIYPMILCWRSAWSTTSNRERRLSATLILIKLIPWR